MSEVGNISESLEDYLEIIFHLVTEKRVARVKDIAARKNVRMASVTSALKRLAKEGYVSYAAREYVELTEQGLETARRVVHRHEFLKRFFKEILFLDDDQAEKDACSVEHHLSIGALERMAAFYQFAVSCPSNKGDVINGFRQCCISNNGQKTNPACKNNGLHLEEHEIALGLQLLSSVSSGQDVTVVRVGGTLDSRQNLIDKGVLPEVPINIESVDDNGVVIASIKGSLVKIRPNIAETIIVRPST